MNRASVAGTMIVRVFKALVRDIVCPIVGVYLLIRIGQGTFDSVGLPVVCGVASTLIGLPLWSRSDEKRRGSGRRRSITVDSGGIRWGEKSEDDEPPRS